MNRVYMKFFNLIFLLFFIFPISSCTTEDKKISSCATEDKSMKDKKINDEKSTPGETRVSAVAGQFYPSSKNDLLKMIDGFLLNTKKQNFGGKIIGLISPHAGYVFSGQTAAQSYKQIEGEKIDTVILIGSSHNYPVKDAAIWNGGNFSTPLGDVAIDEELTKKLLCEGSKIIIANNIVHISEHSLEVQIPFLQRIFPKGNFKIVAILMNDKNSCKQVAEIIAKVIKSSNKSILLVASTDMAHYPAKKDAETIDKSILDAIAKFSIDDLLETNEKWLSKGVPELYCTLCSLPSVFTVMEVSKILGANKSVILDYSNSASTSYGDVNRVVGYGAVVFVKTEVKNKEEKIKNEEKEFSLTEKSQKELLKIARNSIEQYLLSKKIPKFTVTNPEILNNSAVFVTLVQANSSGKKNHSLRGCIGTTESKMPLYETVSQFAVASAINDRRFSPVTKGELKNIVIEISVLSPLKKISSVDEIIEGKHGVIVKKDFHSGLFLPQVWEHPELSKKEAFLSELCSQKAGLESDAWKKGNGVDMYIFTVFAFKENDGMNK
ncbi:MAG: AmmeMemoRadiSam system protein B [Elusimicrobiota bacterium]